MVLVPKGLNYTFLVAKINKIGLEESLKEASLSFFFQ